MAVAEALACGTPAITTTETPWRELTARGCGWCVAPTAAALAGALREALALGENVRTGMGETARACIDEGHSLPATGARFERLYSDLAAEADRS
jgi:glycosyltransferase involved in cell wall biosynthesis